MLNYLWSLLSSLAGTESPAELTAGKWTLATACAALWTEWGHQVAAFFRDPLFLVVTVLWSADFLLGSVLAWQEHRYRARRGLYSVVKWLVWMGALTVGWGFRLNGFPADDFLPILIGVLICWTEGISILRNGARLAGGEGGLLDRMADYLEGEADFQFDRLEAKLRERRRKAGLLEEEIEGPDEGPSSVPGGES